MPAANPTRPLSRRDQQLAKLKARRHGLAWSPTPRRAGAAPLATRDSQDQSIP